MEVYIYAVVCVILIGSSYEQTQKNAKELQLNPCLGQPNCGSCIGAGPLCGWCYQAGWEEKQSSRCDKIDNLIHYGCDMTFIVSPDNVVDYIQNQPPKDQDEAGPPIQLSPQVMNLVLRPNKPVTFELTFRLAEDYPVDLYYLMDLSQSMKNDKDKLAALGNQISDRMSNITKNFRLGFGSFVDKVTMPWISTVPAKLISPCDGCAAPYGFKNQLPLTVNTSLFAGEVQRAPVSGNLDSPEGGFDAIMQATVCKEQIGWRDQSRKMLLFSTDATFHYAGDGKLGGIVTPNDGQCHLDGTGTYTHSTLLDYPSISQIRSKLSENKMNLIFAVTAEQKAIYEKLSDLIEGSSTGELADDSSNIVDLIQRNYDLITSKLELVASSMENISVSFRSKCQGNITRDTSSCDGMKIGDEVTFEVTVEVKSCPVDHQQRVRNITISPIGLTDQLTLQIDLICECDCEKTANEKRNASECSYHGTLECGMCTCDEKRYGKFCECDGTNLQSEDYDAACKMTNDSLTCSGRGECLCGKCYCSARTRGSQQKFSGTFCECYDYDCPRHNKELCGGRGTCNCGQCICSQGYNGSACECPTSQDSCKASNGELCNGRGRCECGKCKCDLESFYRGPTCEDCPTCTGKCNDNKACVQCRAFESGPLSQEECKAKCPEITMQDNVEETAEAKLCQFKDDDDCQFFFTYEYDANNQVIIKAQNTKVCPTPVNVMWIVIGVIAGIVLIGLALLLVWKVLTTIHDRREFAKFEKERLNARWDTGENPIYKQATSTFKNPTYAGSG
ncbi:integrin beta-PS [Lingula anatina]|uniref:Integrin beta n=1 Tax=Lingula anatina TaxID=7574 RepID=A0A1S3IPR8_LINAN|nr:integrin beta-PS [Lingula anatina]|eukprot:XP_013400063.1 integrin beta-PS [Lingula anatina]